MTQLEYKMLNMSKKKQLATEEEGDSSDVNEGVEGQISGSQALKTNNTRKRTDVKDKVQFKRKKDKVMIDDFAFLGCSCFLS